MAKVCDSERWPQACYHYSSEASRVCTFNCLTSSSDTTIWRIIRPQLVYGSNFALSTQSNALNPLVNKCTIQKVYGQSRRSVKKQYYQRWVKPGTSSSPWLATPGGIQSFKPLNLSWLRWLFNLIMSMFVRNRSFAVAHRATAGLAQTNAILQSSSTIQAHLRPVLVPASFLILASQLLIITSSCITCS